MAFSLSLSADFREALLNTLTDQDVDSFLKQPDRSPRFVYGVLMLPTILKYHLDLHQSVNIEKSMTQATLHGYQLYQYAVGDMPTIVQSDDPKVKVEGMLIFGMDREQRNAIHELEGGLARLASVQVQILQRHHKDNKYSMRAIDAGTFEWKPFCSLDSENLELQLIPSSWWDVVPFVQSPLCRHMVQSQDRHRLETSSVAKEGH